MNKIYYLIMAFTTLVSFVSCGNDGESILKVYFLMAWILLRKMISTDGY